MHPRLHASRATCIHPVLRMTYVHASVNTRKSLIAAGVSCVRLCDRHVAFLYIWETVVLSCMVLLRFYSAP